MEVVPFLLAVLSPFLLLSVSVCTQSSFENNNDKNRTNRGVGLDQYNFEQADVMTKELERNRSVFEDRLHQGKLDETVCSNYSPTMAFLCLDTVAKRDTDSPNLLTLKNNSETPSSNDTESFDADVLCTRKKIEPDDNEVHRPVRTISCCQDSGQQCTYDEMATPSSSRGHRQYIAKCHSNSSATTQYLVQCCEKVGSSHVQKPYYNSSSSKCY